MRVLNFASAGTLSLCIAPLTGITSLSDNAKQSACSRNSLTTASLSSPWMSGPIVTSAITASTRSLLKGAVFRVKVEGGRFDGATGCSTPKSALGSPESYSTTQMFSVISEFG
ncbi:hypothetical protein BD779DRAFT_1456377 [Infundibulicybe gibba]|nr:hypothetical protein BD779DRAFT_1456377 [Infundibulicybe gibba]